MAFTDAVCACKREMQSVPFVGTILNALQTVWIDRHGTKGRNSAKQQIIDYVNKDNAPPLVIFPQGTISNVETITVFKVGAFLSKKKSASCCIRLEQEQEL
eukprot:308529_1